MAVSKTPTLAWITDPHLNFAPLADWEQFVSQLEATGADGLLVTGDISEAEDLTWQLGRLRSETNLRIYFVLGNHDFYHGSISGTRKRIRQLCDQHPDAFFYLTGQPPIQLTSEWSLCGDDGWADARIGDYFRSPVRMNDFVLIDDLKKLDDLGRWRFLRREGARAALRLRKQLQAAQQFSSKTLVLTHIPPFREACWYQGEHSSDDWAPFFTCKAVGRELKNFCQKFPKHQVLVLCGHTHSAGRSEILDNLRVWTAGADYGHPRVSARIAQDCFDDHAVDWSFRSA